jgi:CheY-like chemotaxis protein
MDQANSLPVRAFVVGDSKDGMGSLAWLLRVGHHCEVTICPDGPSCLEAVRSCPPHLVFLDLAAPDMNGFRVIEALKVLQLRSTLFVALGDSPSKYYEREGRDAGFDFYEPKPIEAYRLKAIVDEARRSGADSALESVFDVQS